MSRVTEALDALGEYNRAITSLESDLNIKVRRVSPEDLIEYCETHGWTRVCPELSSSIVLRYSVGGIPVHIPKNGNLTEMRNALAVIRSTTAIK